MADEKKLWDEFKRTGSIEDYIKYVNARRENKDVNTD